jgi:hypothetical protein
VQGRLSQEESGLEILWLRLYYGLGMGNGIPGITEFEGEFRHEELHLGQGRV